MSKVFVSYKRVDLDKVLPLVHKMESELGIKFWMDLEGIESYDQFSKRIMKSINESEVFLFMYSKAHEDVDTENDWTVRELNFAHEKKKRIIWVELEDCKLHDWFIFKFLDKQVVKVSDDSAMHKLIEDIRKLLSLTQPSPSSINQTQHPQAIDLGLPSGTKWASCNVGATKPEEYGYYYAWGETEEKDNYEWCTYTYCHGSKKTCNNLGSDITGTGYDVAYLKWGGNWRMPTLKQFKELFEYCYNEWTTQNGVNGRKFTSKLNGSSIFLPAAGGRWYKKNNAGGSGDYWTSTHSSSLSSTVNFLKFDSDGTHWNAGYRYVGRTVRPVSKN